MTGNPPWFRVPAFEGAALDAIIHGEPELQASLTQQGLHLLERKFTGVGLFSEFIYVDQDGRQVESNPARQGKHQIIDSDIYAIIPGTDDPGLGLILHVDEDRILSLEAHTFGPGHWWGSVEQFSLFRCPSVQNDHPSAFRPLRSEELAIVAALCDTALVATPNSETFSRVRARDISDPAGALRFFNVEAVPRRVDRLLAEAEYRDDDEVTVRVALWLDNEGNLFGLDMWKPNLAPLRRYPRPANLNIRTVSGSRVIGNSNLDMFDFNVRGALAAGRDRPDNRDRDGLAWLQSWYLKQCNGEWEHEFGVDIETMDNPGWHLKVQIEGTALEGRRFDLPLVNGLNDRDWIKLNCDGETFEGMGGPSNLDEILNAFRRFAEGNDQLLSPDWAKPH